ncbi:hypothetical protein [Nannocystis punicea]|uniref:Uncharacterized protein n=1 Tax=Nannocystis punicea TaxID=2995304 RepID=A0ABY7GZK7_9BACT|nr:hypothetical protein [Nannocystis poenicansa]WAS92444.1 hypothetical protein O0S08_40210 [Nannocystis poenicansa]
MRMRITEYTWIHTTIFALATAFVTSACDEADAIDEEDLAVEAADEEKPRSTKVDDQAVDDQAVDELTEEDEDEESDEAVRADEERRRDGWGRRRRDGWGRHDDDGWGRRRRDGWGRHDDDGWGRRRDGWGRRHW